jgi:hypothetical protein
MNIAGMGIRGKRQMDAEVLRRKVALSLVCPGGVSCTFCWRRALNMIVGLRRLKT